MNKVYIIGRVTKDPDIKATTDGKTVARFSLALDRGKKDGKDLGADFPNCIAFGKTAEVIEKYVQKGKQIAIDGHIRTGSYEKDDKKVYTTDVIVDRLELLGGKSEGKSEENPYEGYEQTDEDLPF